MTDRSDAGLGLSPDDELTAHRALVDAGYMPPAAYNAAHPREPEPLPVAIPAPVSHYAATAARRIMEGLRERGALCYILARHKPESGVAWAPPEAQAAMENRMAEIIDAVFDSRISELLAANNAEVERRREAEAALDAMKERAEKAEGQLSVVRRQRDDMNAAHQYECRAAREKEKDETEAEAKAREVHAKLIHDFYMREIGRLMQQAEHWAENDKPYAVHHRVNKANAYFQVAVLFDPARRALGFDEPFSQMEKAIASAPIKPDGTYPPSADLARYASPDFFVEKAVARTESELTALRARVAELEGALVVVRRQRDDMNAAYQFECKAGRKKDEALRPFAERATRWEENHPVKSGYQHRDSMQITHRLGDFRTARKALGAAND